MKKHSVLICGHATSISLEEPFWDTLKQMAKEKGLHTLDGKPVKLRMSGENISSLDDNHISQIFDCGLAHIQESCKR